MAWSQDNRTDGTEKLRSFHPESSESAPRLPLRERDMTFKSPCGEASQ